VTYSANSLLKGPKECAGLGWLFLAPRVEVGEKLQRLNSKRLAKYTVVVIVVQHRIERIT
jgi:hypothetical protein